VEELSLRDLQKECTRALLVLGATNNDLAQINKKANHDSQNWYKAVIQLYIDKYGGLPSNVGPGTEVKLLMDSQ
jgi:hypothetical protein